jgi:hypothetical protein
MIDGEKRDSETSAELSSVGLYVYCIAEAGPATSITADSMPPPIEDDSRLELIVVGDLAAVASGVPLSMYGEASFNENLTDASWTAIRAMRHERVVEHFAKRTAVVPLRFGTVYLNRNRVEEMLDAKASDLREIIERIRGCEEWGVNVFSDRQKLLEAVAELSPRLRDLSEQAQKASPGQAYLLQKKVEGLRTDEARVELARILEEVEAKLSRKAKAVERLRMLKVETTESGDLKAKFAFLIERSKFDDFRDEAESTAQEINKAGIRLELTGPWPVYNFTT